MASLARILARNLHASARRDALSKFVMPAMSPTMTEGGISQWKKKEGESFSAGDVLLEIETDKATIDVEAQDDGVLAKIISQDGAKNVAIGTPIAIVGEPGDDLSGADALAAEKSDEAPKKKEAPKQESKPAAKLDVDGNDPFAPTPVAPETKPVQYDFPSDRLAASPIAKRIALERGIPLAKVKGTGPNGRIVKEDVEKFKPEAASAAAPAAPGQAGADYVDTPVSSMRRVIGQRLTQSKQELPHYYLTVDIDMGKVLKLREVFNQGLAEKGAKLSVNDFVVKATALALAEVPEANTAWLGETIRQYKKADISVAVATANGLITPIIKDAGGKGLASISSEAKALAKKARDGKLAPHEYQGGTFTISNLGMYDISHFTAIINPPQACILAVGSTSPTIVPAPEEERGFRTAQIMKVTLSSDHRVVDGAVGARWLQSFKRYLENPLTFML
ncbi:dihydrolipoamide acetyltransferase [Exidia glandulosa HHB12029]|uniref:Acetyltransferase component of pyruvate dehydrogenase complex n=1 Tax=Exidia glandulosa HHB12029 TaxID=1314781 RepID=A0A165IR91_EXIGL|nr:dihydrolipoamide acetyltransferase [Exidia glandulosa HHB12029]